MTHADANLLQHSFDSLGDTLQRNRQMDAQERSRADDMGLRRQMLDESISRANKSDEHQAKRDAIDEERAKKGASGKIDQWFKTDPNSGVSKFTGTPEAWDAFTAAATKTHGQPPQIVTDPTKGQKPYATITAEPAPGIKVTQPVFSPEEMATRMTDMNKSASQFPAGAKLNVEVHGGHEYVVGPKGAFKEIKSEGMSPEEKMELSSINAAEKDIAQATRKNASSPNPDTARAIAAQAAQVASRKQALQAKYAAPPAPQDTAAPSSADVPPPPAIGDEPQNPDQQTMAPPPIIPEVGAVTPQPPAGFTPTPGAPISPVPASLAPKPKYPEGSIVRQKSTGKVFVVKNGQMVEQTPPQ